MEVRMLTDSEPHAAARERLSALVDGELEGGAVTRACGLWHEASEMRSAWHAYHLIGDVLRSDDLARDPAQDAEFLRAFRARLAAEPVVLAPRPLASAVQGLEPVVAGVANATGHRRTWAVPTAVAAGFVAVAGVLMLTRAPGLPPDRAVDGGVAQVAPTQDGARPASVPASPAAVEPQALVADGQLIRDARLDRYLDAHKQFAGSSALGVPSGFLRSATTVNAPDR
jgi:sigma-E factor negative regulatory protein RseA